MGRKSTRAWRNHRWSTEHKSSDLEVSIASAGCQVLGLQRRSRELRAKSSYDPHPIVLAEKARQAVQGVG